MTVMEASTPLWFFESHSNSKRSQWLQSTLSELEDKTRGMLKLIEGDADTFAQRAEMYCKKRPELVNMIEDIYRSYRSLAESHDQLRLGSGNSALNRKISLTSRSFSNESLAPSMVTSNSDSDFEVDDPVQEVESKIKETQVECMVEESTDKNSEVCIVKPVVEEIRSKKSIFTEYYAMAASNIEITDKIQVCVYREREETHAEDQFIETQLKCVLEKSSENNSEICVVKPMVQEIRSKENILTEDLKKAASKMQFNDKNEVLAVQGNAETHSELEEDPDTKSEFREIKSLIKSSKATQSYAEREVERLKGEIAAYKVELERKDEEKREVIRQLSASIDMLKEENDRMKNFIKELKKQRKVFESGKLKDVFRKNPFGKHFRFPNSLVAV